MPTYNYKCKECDYTFEVFKPVSERATDTCPICNKEASLQIQKAAFVLYGYCYENNHADDNEKHGPR